MSWDEVEVLEELRDQARVRGDAEEIAALDAEILAKVKENDE